MSLIEIQYHVIWPKTTLAVIKMNEISKVVLGDING